jgi:chromosome segregation protein
MHLKSLTLKGFKSFPDRTRLEFGPGVSVVVGPNGSGKSNITDAVLWVLGEQSPLAVRGASMQDVIFGGGPGTRARDAAEVEIVLDNVDGTVALPWSEISVVRRLERSGEGEYRLGGARCRLIDIIEALSDTGLGREAHSVVSQGRIESIVASKPRERRMLIEEAAGLSKHRKRRRRAQFKLERTQRNLDRALDVEREARAALRPLARQAQAAELLERLERQMLETRLEFARRAWLDGSAELQRAQARAQRARRERDQLESELAAVMAQRASVERGLAERAQRHDALVEHLYRASAARERLELRAEQTRTLDRALAERTAASERAPSAPEHATGWRTAAAAALEGERRVRALERELAELQASYQAELGEQTEALEREHARLADELAGLRSELEAARARSERAAASVEAERTARSWESSWSEVHRIIVEGIRRVTALPAGRDRDLAAGEVVERAERVARAAVERALGAVGGAEEAHASSERAVQKLERRLAEVSERERRSTWLIGQRHAAVEHRALALRRAQLEGELGAESRQLQRLVRERAEQAARQEEALALQPLMRRLTQVIETASQSAGSRLTALQAELASDRSAGAEVAEELRECAHAEADLQGRLRASAEQVTRAELEAQQSSASAAAAEAELDEIAEGLGLSRDDDALARAPAPTQEQLDALAPRLERLRRRREQLGPVNPLAQAQHAEAQAHVAELAARREDLEAALRELRAVIRDADRQIRETFEATFESVARGFEEVIGEVFPGGSGRLRLVRAEAAPRASLGDAAGPEAGSGNGSARAFGAAGRAERGDEDADGGEADAERGEDDADAEGSTAEDELLGVEIEVTPAGKSSKRLSLLSGGEKSMTALAFLFAVFLARPCPFYVLDEVEAALDDLNLDRFLALLRRCATRAQFIVMTHQRLTMQAANWLYGVSMGEDGVSRVISRQMEAQEAPPSAREGVNPAVIAA